MTSKPSVIEVQRTYEAPIDRVFAAFANPELLKAWAAPNEHTNEWVELDFRVGGVYRRGMRFPDGALHVLVGTFSEIVRPHRLSYSFAWETIPELGSSVVTIELSAIGSATRVFVRHVGLPAEVVGDFHAGWESCLAKLASVIPTEVGTESSVAHA